jgi:hypothetical protein
LRQYHLVGGRLVGPVAESSSSFAYPGATPSVSADGSTDGIVWDIDHAGSRVNPASAVLYAYSASKVSQQLFSSNMAGARDQLGTAVKFAVPTIAGGKVYVATETGLSVFGLLS